MSDQRMASPMLTRVPKVAGPMVAAIIRTIFVPRGKRDLVGAQFDEVVTMLARSHPTVADWSSLRAIRQRQEAHSAVRDVRKTVCEGPA